ncbi:MAG: ion channel [Novosphingobium sp.]
MAKPFDPRRTSSIAGAILRDDPMRVRPLGGGRWRLLDAYHQLMQLSWPRLCALFVACFMVFNLTFAALYAMDPGGLAVPHDAVQLPLFWLQFFFSVHTVATIGYGNVYPVSLFSNVVVVVEITLGILFFALTTGIVFSRFSRPTARILFSHAAVIREIDGVPTLMLRAANQRHNLIYSAHARLAVLEDGDIGGTRMRRFIDLPLVRESNPVFALTWTIMHAIDDASPLRGWLDAAAPPDDTEVVVLLSGFDESSGQTIYGRWAYQAEHFAWNARFVDIVGTADDGARTIDYARFHDVDAA